MKTGVVSIGIKCPYIRENDDLEQIVIDSILKTITLDNNDVIGITESVIARAQGNYVTIDELAKEIKSVMNNPQYITITDCIYSRNRFAMILKAFARAAGESIRIYMPAKDEVGNVVANHPFTRIDYSAYYKEIVEAEGKQCFIYPIDYTISSRDINVVYCGLHNFKQIKASFPNLFTLTDFFSDKCEYGLLGCNKATEEKIKLFPNTSKAQALCESIKRKLLKRTGKSVIVVSYGDGCFKDPIGGIWEFADPITMPAYTDKELIESSPNEVKVKAILDEGKSNEQVNEIIKNKSSKLVGNMLSQGTTPRKYRDLLASLMDLTSGSGDRCTPVVLIKNYFNLGNESSD